jgi:hypothetical protein
MLGNFNAKNRLAPTTHFLAFFIYKNPNGSEAFFSIFYLENA